MIDTSYAEGVRRADVRRYLDRGARRQPGTKIQYGHPSPRYWSPAPRTAFDAWAPRRSERPLALYLHIPFCPPTDPPACGFCLFAREDFDSYPLIRRYLRDLYAELDSVAERLDRRPLRAVYVGGGTPNLLKPADVARLFERIRRAFAIHSETEITFEGTPALFTPERLEALAAAGVTRVSIGVQTLDPSLLGKSGRHQQRSQVERAVAHCRDHGLLCSADLITGWFGQSSAHVVADVDGLIDWGVTGIVNHPLTLAGDSPFARRRHELPAAAETCRAFRAARDRLGERGFRADSYTDYRRSDLPPVEYLELYRDVLGNDRVGVGYGANSLLAGSLGQPGHTFRNVSGTAAYAERVSGLAGGGSCAAWYFSFSVTDLRLLHVLKGLEGTPRLSASRYRETFGSDLAADFAPWWEELEARGWLVWQGDGPRLSGDGVFYTALVQRSLAEPRNAELRHAFAGARR